MKEEIRFSFGKGTGGEISGWAKVSEIVNHKARFIKDGGDKRFFNEIVELTVIPQFENEPQMIEDWFCINMLDCFNNTDIVRLDVVVDLEELKGEVKEKWAEIEEQNKKISEILDPVGEITETTEEIFEPDVIEEIKEKLSEMFGETPEVKIPYNSEEQKNFDEKEAYDEEEFRNAVIEGLNDRDTQSKEDENI